MRSTLCRRNQLRCPGSDEPWVRRKSARPGTRVGAQRPRRRYWAGGFAVPQDAQQLLLFAADEPDPSCEQCCFSAVGDDDLVLARGVQVPPASTPNSSRSCWTSFASCFAARRIGELDGVARQRRAGSVTLEQCTEEYSLHGGESPTIRPRPIPGRTALVSSASTRSEVGNWELALPVGLPHRASLDDPRSRSPNSRAVASRTAQLAAGTR